MTITFTLGQVYAWLFTIMITAIITWAITKDVYDKRQ